ncbi:MAG: hypothetical protein SFX73_19715 [Kofleriaceae bacterium]|nr:hypothetical protein [Kofleriaceae bacterium]
MLAEDLLAHLACPVSKQRMIYFPRGAEGGTEADACLVSVAARLRYRVDGRVPVLLQEEAERLTEAQVNQLIDRAKALGLAVPA